VYNLSERIDQEQAREFTLFKYDTRAIGKRSIMYSALHMAEGKSIALMPTDAEISTQQAAEILNVSRPHVIKLLEKGDIPYKKVGSHRRILLQDILEYEAIFKKKRRKQLNKLAAEAQKLNLGY